MLETPAATRFQAQVERLIDSGLLHGAPLPRKVEVALTGADPARFVVDSHTGEVAARQGMAPPMCIAIPRRIFEDLAGKGPMDWLAAYDKGVIEIQGDPVKVDVVQVYIEKVLRPKA